MAVGVSAPAAPLGRRAIAYFLDGFVLVPAWILYAVVLDAVFGPLVATDPAGTGVVVVAIDARRRERANQCWELRSDWHNCRPEPCGFRNQHIDHQTE